MTGKLRLDTTPSGANVKVNNQTLGTTPIDVQDLDPGVYYVLMANNGYKPYGFNAIIKDDQINHIDYNFVLQNVKEEYLDITTEKKIVNQTIPSKIQPIQPVSTFTKDAAAVPESDITSPTVIPTAPSSQISLSDTTAILNSLDNIASLLKQLIQNTNQQTTKFDTGIQTLPNAVLTVPFPDNVSTTGYTRIAVWDIINRLSQTIFLINNGPGTIYLRTSNNGSSFSAAEIPVFAGEKATFNNIYEFRIRTTLPNTSYRITEHESNLIINNFDDRVATAAHISASTNLGGPQPFTVLATYTVPTGYKAKVNGVRVRESITGVAGVPSERQMIIAINNPTLGLFPMIGATIGADHNAVGYTVEWQLGYAYTLLTGESVQIILDQDLSTGGNIQYFGSAEITQYFSYIT